MLTSRLAALFSAWFLTSLLTANLGAQDLDVARLVHPEVAQRLSLDDEQRAAIQKLLLERTEKLATTAEEGEKKAIAEDYQARILEVLTAEQQAQFATVQPLQKLMFQFRDMKWEDVLNWFTQQQDLTLVMDRTPGGSFTYSDTRAYSPSEAIDLLNSVLMTRGFTLVRREKMLVVMELSDSIPLELLPRVTLEELDERGRFELVSVLFPLGGRPSDAVLQEVRPYLSSYGRVIPLARGSQLLVVETAGKMKTINELIAAVPLPKPAPKPDKPAPPPKPVFAAYPLGDLESAAVLTTIRKLIPSEQITVDAKTSVLSAFVIPDQQAAIKSAIEQMQASQAELPAAESIAYRFSGIKAEELQKQIASLAPRATVTATADRVLVTAEASEQQLIRTALQALDVEPLSVDKSLRVFEVTPSYSEPVGNALRSFLPNSYVAVNAQVGSVLVRGSAEDLQLAAEIIEIWQQSQATDGLNLRAFALDRPAGSEWLATVQQIIPEAKAWLGDEGRQLLLLGHQQEVAAIERILPQLLSVLPEPDLRQLQIYPLSKNQRARRGSLNQLPQALADIKLVDGQNNEEVLVWASPEQHAAFAELLQQIDQPLTPPTTQSPKSYALQVQDTATVTRLLTAEFPEAQLTLQADGEELTVLASEELQQKIAARITDFNAELPPRPKLSFESYSVQGMPVAALQQALAPLLAGTETTTDSKGQRLLVRADSQTHAALRELAAALGADPEPDPRQLKIYPLSRNQLARRGSLNQLPQTLADITLVDGQNNAELLVWASPEQHAAFADLLQQIDQPPTPPTTQLPKSYALQVQDTATVTRLLTAEFPEAQLTLQGDGEELTVLASEELQQKIAARIADFNAELPPRPKLSFESYSVQGMTATALQQALAPLLSGAQATVDSEGQRLLVRADSQTHAELRELATALSAQPDVGQQKVVVAYPLTHATASNVKQVIEQVAGNATILADDKLRQLVVTGTLQTQATVKATLEQIDRAGNARAAEQMRSYDTQELNAASLLPTLQAMWPQMQLTADTRANRIVASGTEQEQQELRLAIEQLVSAPGDGSQLVKTYPVPFGDLRTLPAVLRQLAPQALISSDVSSRTVTVWAQEPQQERVQQALEELGKTVEGALQPATYKVKPTQLAAVQSSLRSLFPNMGVAADASTGQLIVIASAATQERVAAVLELLANGSTDEEKTTKVFQFDPQRVELTDLLAALQSTIPNEVRLESNPSNNTVLAIGLPQDLDRVTELVEQLLEQLPAVEPSEIRSYDASQFNAAALLPSLQAMWPRMQLTVDSGANRIVAKGSAALQQELQTALGKLADAPQGAAQVVKTYPVPFGEMGSLPVILQRLAPQAVISSDYTSRTVTVWALESQHARVQQTLSELAKTAEQGMQPATYLVDPTQLAAAQNSLRTLFPTLSISADATTGQLIVVAAEATQQRVAAVLELLAQGPNGQEKTVKVWQLDPQRVALSDLLLALQSTIPAQVRLESNPANNSIVAIGAPAALEQVAVRVEQLLQDLPAPAALTSVVYPLQNANPASAMTVLTRLLPTATFAQDPLSKTIAATARAEEHRTIAEFIESFDEPRSSGKETHVYRLQRGNGQGLAYVLGNLMPEATFYGSRQHGALVATALPEQHERIAAIVKDFDIDRENTETRVFPVGNANARSLQDAVRDLASEAAVTADSATNSLIVTATTEELERIAAVVEQVESGGSQPRTTRFYPVLGSEPLPLSRALERSFPQATLAADNASGGLFATATEDEHTAIAQVVESLNLQPTRLPTLRSFGLKHTSPEIVAGAIRDALGRRTSAGVSFNRETRSVFVVGSRDDLRVAEALVEQIDVPHSVDDSRKLRVFSLGGADGRAVTEAIENLFAEAAGQVDVRYDSFNEQLFVVGDPQQLTLVAETLEQLAPPERQLQIIQLNATDPLSFQLAAEALFEDEPYNSAPTITVDSNQQQVLIRATPSQMQAIRQLLQQMGEAGGTAGSGLGAAVGARNATGAGRLRFVPVHRNSQKLLDEIQRLWPTVRGNPLDVVRPPSREGRLPAEPQAAHGQSAPPTAVGQGSHSGSSQSPLDGGQLGAAGDVRLASTQSSEAISPETAPSDSETTREAASETTPPIVIVVGEEQWTLASADTEGLDQFQRLLDTLLSPRIAPFATSGNYSVYLLSHAGAEEVEDMLDDLFRPERSRNSSFSSTMQRVKIVSDARINALIVSGSRADRRIVEELLGVLDSEDLLDSLQQVTPTMLTLKNASAVNAERIIRDVYRSQLSSGAGRRPVSIPEGVSSEVASLLQQINAQASGPLLTVAVDETSNSLVVRAPAELTAEIRAFVHSLDQQAEDTPSRRVDLIRLQSTNTRNLEKALKILLAK